MKKRLKSLSSVPIGDLKFIKDFQLMMISDLKVTQTGINVCRNPNFDNTSGGLDNINAARAFSAHFPPPFFGLRRS